LRREKWRDLGAARISWKNAAQGDAVSDQAKSGFLRIPLRAFLDAKLTQEANKYMQAELRWHKARVELAALYQRRETVSALIRSLERYKCAKVRCVPICSRRAPRAAA
jgi:hypothetical protein